MRSYSSLSAGLVLAVFTLAAPIARASTVLPLLPPISFNGQVSGEGHFSNSPTYSETCTKLPCALAKGINDKGSGPNNEAEGKASSTLTMSLYNPTTHVFDPEIAGTANATLTQSNGVETPVYSATASGDMLYRFEVTGAPTENDLINVVLTGDFTISSGSGSASLLIYQGLTDSGVNDPFQGDPLSEGPISESLSIELGQLYTVEMQFGISAVTSGVFNQPALAQGILDPTLTPPSGYAITYSPNLSATPLPASLPLFASSLGFLGFLGWRRKKRMASAG
jgi:hypothetical protein